MNPDIGGMAPKNTVILNHFGVETEEKIEFFSPLTLILGQNGCGKTTIIEALKAMSSGSMPPNSEGGKRFVHDPKIEAAPETKASIKMIFNSTDQKEILAMRTYRVTQRAGKRLEFRKMDQILKYIDQKGKEHSVSNSCIDMDAQMAKFFGVSKAVLQNVIFCHQEETLWPFSDQAHLKRIFDEIFDTEKYTRILQELRQESKRYKTRKKELNIQFDLTSKDFELYKAVLKNIEESREKISSIQDTSNELDIEIESKKIAMKEYEQKDLQLQSIEKDLLLLTHQAKELKEQFQRIHTNPLYKDFGKKKEELEQMLEKQDQTKQEFIIERDRLQKLVTEVLLNVSSIDKNILTLQINQKHFEEIIREEEELKKEFNIVISHKLFESLGISNSTIQEVSAILTKIQSYIKQNEEKLQQKENELVNSKNQLTVLLKLKAEEMQELQKMLIEKQHILQSSKDTDKSPLCVVSESMADIYSSLKPYGLNSEDQKSCFVNLMFNSQAEFMSKLQDYIFYINRLIELQDKRSELLISMDSSKSKTLAIEGEISLLQKKIMILKNEIIIKEQQLGAINTPIAVLENEKSELKEHLSILNRLQVLSSKYEWTLYKRKDLGATSSLEEYRLLESSLVLSGLLAEQQQITEQISHLDRILNDSQLLRSQLEMNVNKYEIQRQVKNIKAQFEEKQKEKNQVLSDLEGKAALQDSLLNLQNKYHEFLGELKNLNKYIQSQEKDLQSSQYLNIEGTIYDLQLKMLTAEKISDAIMSRHNAIEEAVMVYHNTKMEEINKTIRDLWKLAYKGKDIDMIEIKSDIDKSSSRYHSFNYRITSTGVLGNEMDMRGRSSAGQKVLGSLVIRLALAEAFCRECGILALDEPTTNLDTENISGLAEALSDIINERAGHRNFQLIVISHDEPFIQALGTKFTDYIWKVDKDDRGHSVLHKIDIKEVV